MGFDAERLIQRDRFYIFNGHSGCDGDDLAEFVELAHGVVEDGGDDAAVAVSGRAGVAAAEAEMADEALPFLLELQVHAVGIVGAAGEAEVFLLGMRFCGVAAGVNFSGHVGCIVIGFLESRGGRVSSVELLDGAAGGGGGASRKQVPLGLRPFGMTSLFTNGEER